MNLQLTDGTGPTDDWKSKCFVAGTGVSPSLRTKFAPLFELLSSISGTATLSLEHNHPLAYSFPDDLGTGPYLSVFRRDSRQDKHIGFVVSLGGEPMIFLAKEDRPSGYGAFRTLNAAQTAAEMEANWPTVRSLIDTYFVGDHRVSHLRSLTPAMVLDQKQLGLSVAVSKNVPMVGFKLNDLDYPGRASALVFVQGKLYEAWSRLAGEHSGLRPVDLDELEFGECRWELMPSGVTCDLDPRNEDLFVFSKQKIVIYPCAREREFRLALLADPTFRKRDQFRRAVDARDTGYQDIYKREFCKLVSDFSSKKPEELEYFVGDFYRSQRESCPELLGDLPIDWRQILTLTPKNAAPPCNAPIFGASITEPAVLRWPEDFGP